jgi:hypothetical protein
MRFHDKAELYLKGIIKAITKLTGLIIDETGIVKTGDNGPAVASQQALSPAERYKL